MVILLINLLFHCQICQGLLSLYKLIISMNGFRRSFLIICLYTLLLTVIDL